MRGLLLAAALCCSIPASAHTNEYLATIKGPNGGRVQMSGPFHFEIIVTGDILTVHVTDHGDRKIDTAGGTARALLRSGRRKITITLTPAGENRFSGRTRGPVDADTAVHLRVTLPGASPETVHFPPAPAVEKATNPPDGHEHHR